jgi:L,D-peptidoglycan transpeptidase YkuD (ErfK/YbiS/YcfS/YnhG family)
MFKKYLLVLCFLFVLTEVPSTIEATTDDLCESKRSAEKVYWKSTDIKKGQIGRIIALKDTPLYKEENGKAIFSRTMKKGEQLILYRIKPDRYVVPNGKYAKKDGNIKVEMIPSYLLNLSQCNFKAEERLKQEAQQLIVVNPSLIKKTEASLSLYEKKNGKWIKISKDYSAIIGKAGAGKTVEGDKKTPRGTYKLGTAFGWGKKPAVLQYPYVAVTKYDYWVDDPSSQDYNKWVHYMGDPYKKWKSFEKLNHPLYKYAIVIEYNTFPVEVGKGSAIFLHIKSKTDRYTLGCIAINEKDIITLLKWLDHKKKPIIEIK